MPRSPFFRLQFSLRALLILMALVGVGIVVFRWPWTVVVDAENFRTTTQFHRGWNGKPVKHGLESERWFEGRTFERWFDEGLLSQERIIEQGVVIGETAYRAGKLHGRHWYVDSSCRTEGQYDLDRPDGTWTYTRAETVERSEWKLGQRHGRQEWRTRAGRVLQSANYEHGRLVQWNDRGVAEELRRWVEANVTDGEQRRLILTPITGAEDVLRDDGYFGELVYYTGGRRIIVQRRFNYRYVEGEEVRKGSTLGEGILAEAFTNSYTFAYRFNMLHVVPINAGLLDGQDRTGVADVHFEPDSQQAKAWLQPVTSELFLHPWRSKRFREMFSPESETGIVIDTDPTLDEGFVVFTGAYAGPYLGFARRDLLGLHLDREGCYCEQHGNTLVIKRRK